MVIKEEKQLRAVLREMIDEYMSQLSNMPYEAKKKKKHHSHDDDEEDEKHEGDSGDKKSHMRNVVIAALKNEFTDCAPYFYYLWPDKEKSAARSYGIKCRDGELNDNGDPYAFSESEIVKLYSKLASQQTKKSK